MADAGKPQPEGLDKNKMKQFLVPAVAVAAVIVLVGLVIYVSGGSRKMSDGSDGSADDPALKQLTPGVKFRDLKEGVGEPCPPGANVTIHYTGWRTDGEVFDSTREGAKATRKPAQFPLPDLIPGWQEGIPGIKRGGIRKLVVAPEKGYGGQNKPGLPPNSTLIFEVELVDFSPATVRPRRTPAPTDLTKLSDGTAPGAEDPGLKPIGTGGLKYRDTKEGDGPVVQAGATVVVDYTGWLTRGGDPFDSSWKARPATFALKTGRGGVIAGWVEGVPGMKVGGMRKLVIPPELGYGADGFPPDIPPSATLVFEIEVLGIE